jgi:hypothetical protein
MQPVAARVPPYSSMSTASCCAFDRCNASLSAATQSDSSWAEVINRPLAAAS